jgi:glycine/D-amino acid oxidase-like deaminating enzyme
MVEHGEAASAMVARSLRLARAAIDEWRGLESLLDADLEVAMDGGMMVAETPAEMALLERKVARENVHGLRVDLLDGPAALRRAPYLSDRVIGAAFCPDEGHAGPRAVTAAFARAAASAGAQFITERRLVGVARSPPGFAVSVGRVDAGPAERVATRWILCAAGAGTMAVGQIANLHLPLFPVALTMTVTERRPPMIPHLVQHAGRRLSLKQTHAGNLLIGGGWPARLATAPTPPYGFDLDRPAALRTDSLAENLRAAVSVVPSASTLNVLRTWTGVVAETQDQIPVLGEVPQAKGFFVAAGGAGFTLGPTLARLASELILTGRASQDVACFSPARFGALNSGMGL